MNEIINEICIRANLQDIKEEKASAQSNTEGNYSNSMNDSTISHGFREEDVDEYGFQQ